MPITTFDKMPATENKLLLDTVSDFIINLDLVSAVELFK